MNTPKIYIHKHTFGSSKAAETLADILTEHSNARLNAKVSAFLTAHNTMLNQLSNVTDVSVRLAFINMVGDRIKHAYLKNWPERVITYTKNVAQANVKRFREMDETIIRNDIADLARRRDIIKTAKNLGISL